MNLFVYIRDKEFYYYAGTENVSGIFEFEQDISNFLKENRVSLLTIIFSRPSVFIRTLEFPFSSLKKISEVILEEAKPLFPVSADGLEFFWYPVLRNKSKTTVSVLAFEKSKIEKWRKYVSSRKCKIKIGFEPFILLNYISRTIQQNNFSGIFVDGNYILKLIVRNNTLVESSSLYMETEMSAGDFSHIIENRPEGLPGVCVAEATGISEMFQGYKIVNVYRKNLSSIIFRLIESYSNIVQNPFKLYPIKQKSVSISSGVVAIVILFFAVAAFMFRPHLIAKQSQGNLDALNRQMEQVFKAAFPEVTRVVNPLIQARERLKNTGEVQQTIPKISVISIMKVISESVPESISFRVSQMSLRGSDLFLTCSTNTLENVDTLVQIFNKSRIFREIKVGGIMPEGDQVSFTLLIKVEGHAKK